MSAVLLAASNAGADKKQTSVINTKLQGTVMEKQPPPTRRDRSDPVIQNSGICTVKTWTFRSLQRCVQKEKETRVLGWCSAR